MQLLGALGIILAGWLIYRAVSHYGLEEIEQSIRSVPPQNLIRSAVFAAGSYLALTAFDFAALRHDGRRLPYGRVALAAFVSLSLAHTIGLSGLSSGALRYRFYSRCGLSAGDVAKLVLFSGATIALGLLTLGGIALIADPSLAQRVLHLPAWGVRMIGALSIGGAGLYFALSFRIRGSLGVGDWRLSMPTPRIALAQILLGTLNELCVAESLRAALASASDASLLDVAAAYVTGNILTIISHVPGGLGVIEGTILYLLPSSDSLIGPLILFRVIYYLAPLALGLLLLGSAEIRFRIADRAGRPEKPCN